MDFGTAKGAVRPIPLKIVEVAADAPEQERANATYLRTLRVLTRNVGRRKALEVQRRGAELQAAGDAYEAAAYVVRELVLGIVRQPSTQGQPFEPFMVDDQEDAISLGSGVHLDVLVDQLDGQHLLELVAMTALDAQAPTAAQLGF